MDQIPNFLLNPQISWKAKGILTFLLHFKTQEEVSVTTLIKEILPKYTLGGRRHTTAALDELIRGGYVHRFHKRKNGKMEQGFYRASMIPTTPEKATEQVLSEGKHDAGELIYVRPDQDC